MFQLFLLNPIFRNMIFGASVEMPSSANSLRQEHHPATGYWLCIHYLMKGLVHVSKTPTQFIATVELSTYKEGPLLSVFRNISSMSQSRQAPVSQIKHRQNSIRLSLRHLSGLVLPSNWKRDPRANSLEMATQRQDNPLWEEAFRHLAGHIHARYDIHVCKPSVHLWDTSLQPLCFSRMNLARQ
jgi:hypothetical protein